jgi:hypothetical protein
MRNFTIFPPKEKRTEGSASHEHISNIFEKAQISFFFSFHPLARTSFERERERNVLK